MFHVKQKVGILVPEKWECQVPGFDQGATQRFTLSVHRVVIAIICYIGVVPALGQSDPELGRCRSAQSSRGEMRDALISRIEDYRGCILAPAALGCDFRFNEISAARENYRHAIDDADVRCAGLPGGRSFIPPP